MNILIMIAAIGGFIKIVETIIKITKMVNNIIDNFRVWNRIDKKMKEMKKA